jgi:hypothetical protein
MIREMPITGTCVEDFIEVVGDSKVIGEDSPPGDTSGVKNVSDGVCEKIESRYRLVWERVMFQEFVDQVQYDGVSFWG